MMAEKIILGIDPGTNLMGYGILRVMGNKAETVSYTHLTLPTNREV